MANRNAIIACVVVVIIAVAAVAVYALKSNDDGKDGAPVVRAGDSMTFNVFGTDGDEGTLIDGTLTMKILEVTDTQYKIETQSSIYDVATDGTRTPFNTETVTSWQDKDDGMESKGTKTVETFWGKKTLSLFESEDGKQHYLVDGDVIYAAMIEGDGTTVYMELTDCTLIKDKKVEREVHEATITMTGSAESGGYEFNVAMIYTGDDKDSAIFMRNVIKTEIAGQISSETSWNDPFGDAMAGMSKTGTEKIDTAWGTKETDVYKKVENGQTIMLYAYKDVPVRMTSEASNLTMALDAVSITVDGKEATLDEAAKL